MSYALLYEGHLVKGRASLDATKELDAFVEAVALARKRERGCPGLYYLEKPDGTRVSLTPYLRDPFYQS
jgi:hypothetical protein